MLFTSAQCHISFDINIVLYYSCSNELLHVYLNRPQCVSCPSLGLSCTCTYLLLATKGNISALYVLVHNFEFFVWPGQHSNRNNTTNMTRCVRVCCRCLGYLWVWVYQTWSWSLAAVSVSSGADSMASPVAHHRRSCLSWWSSVSDGKRSDAWSNWLEPSQPWRRRHGPAEGQSAWALAAGTSVCNNTVVSCRKLKSWLAHLSVYAANVYPPKLIFWKIIFRPL